MLRIERRNESLAIQRKPDDLAWDGDLRYSVVAKVLRQSQIAASPYGNSGITFTLGGSGAGGPHTYSVYGPSSTLILVIESAIYDTSSVVGISNSTGGYRLSRLMGEKRAFSVDVIAKACGSYESIGAPTFGPAYDDPEKFASAFFFTIKDCLSQHLALLPSALIPLMDIQDKKPLTD